MKSFLFSILNFRNGAFAYIFKTSLLTKDSKAPILTARWGKVEGSGVISRVFFVRFFMFYGEYKHNLDVKGRLFLPATFRDIFKKNNIEKFFVTRGLDKCIFMFSDEEWRNQEQKFKNMSFTKQESRSFNRMFFSGAVETIPDSQGRFIIPQYLKDFAKIDRETVIIGVSNRIEVWSSVLWKDFYENSRDTFEQTAENVLNM